MASRWLVYGALLLLLTGCTAGKTGPSSTSQASTKTAHPTAPLSSVNNESTLTFMLSGGATGKYTLHTAQPTSKLRHGHREFTIDIEQATTSVFLVFYGYDGPGAYTLAQVLNGGDVHIGLRNNTASWDLSLQPKARCSLIIQSDIPTQQAGLHRMKGTFSCPRLFSSAPQHPQKPITVSHGSFDVALIVES